MGVMRRLIGSVLIASLLLTGCATTGAPTSNDTEPVDQEAVEMSGSEKVARGALGIGGMFLIVGLSAIAGLVIAGALASPD